MLSAQAADQHLTPYGRAEEDPRRDACETDKPPSFLERAADANGNWKRSRRARGTIDLESWSEAKLGPSESTGHPFSVGGKNGILMD